jgi:hypothetical protein
MFTQASTDDYRTVAPGVELRVLFHGAATILEDPVAVEVSSPVRDDDLPVALA